MRPYYYLFFCLFYLLSFNLNAQSYEGADAEKIVPSAASVLMGNQSSVPTFVVMNEDHQIPVQAFQQWERTTFQYSEGISFSTRKTVKGQDGLTHQFRDQLYRGIPVDNALSVIHSKDGLVTYFNGDIHNELSLSTTPGIRSKVAIQAALKHLNIDPTEWDRVNQTSDDISVDGAPHHEHLEQSLVIYPYNGEYFLAWKIHLLSHHFDTYKFVYVDAQKGNIINSFKATRGCNGGTANTTWRGNRAIQTDQVGANFILHNDCAPRNIRTRNGATNADFTDADNNWTSTNNFTRAGYTAHWGVTQAFDYYNNTHGQLGMDGTTGTVNVAIRDNFFNAQFLPGTNNLEFGLGAGVNNTTANDDLTTLDICGHEYTHGVMENTGGITGFNHETNALHEGISDIFGDQVEAAADGAAPEWSIGEEVTGFGMRLLNNPNGDIHSSGANGSPDTYNGTFWSGNFSHVDGGVVRFWFFLLSQGGNGQNDNGTYFNVQGIGRATAINILYEAISNGSFGANPTYNTARTATLQAAVNLFGACSNQRIQVANAWKAVGVGSSLTPDISISTLTTSLGAGNNVAPQGTFTVNYNLTTANTSFGYTSTYVGAFLRSYCTSSGLTSPFDVEVENITCGGTVNRQSSLTLPAGLTPGFYTLIIKADVFDGITETSEYNNIVCTTINITDPNPKPDLVPKYASVSPTTVQAGNSVSAFTYLYNDGTAYGGSSSMCYYLSTNSTYSGDDVYLGVKSFSGLNPGTSTSGSLSLVIPGSTTPGTYYLLYRADCYSSVSESNENNNVTSRSITVTAPPSNLPDLVINNVSPGPSTGSPPSVTKGQYITVTYTLANQVSGTSVGTSSTRIYLSLNNSVGSGDFLVNTVYGQSPGSKSASIQIPYSAQNQYYYILVVADYDNNVVESIESNNIGNGHVIVVSGFNSGEEMAMTFNDSESVWNNAIKSPTNNSLSTFNNDREYEISIFPNPTNSQFTLRYPVQEKETVSINLCTITGKKLSTSVLKASEQTGQWQYTGLQLPTGLYFVYWQTDKETKAVKLVVE